MSSSSQENSPPTQRSSSSGTGKPVSEESAIFNTFMLVIRNKFIATTNSPTHEGGFEENKMNRLDEIYRSESYAAEKRQLTKINNNGMTAGIVIGLGSFVFLRSGPRLISRYLLNRSRGTGSNSGGSGNMPGGYQFDINKTTTNHQPPQMIQPPESKKRPGFLFRVVKFSLDVFVSMSLGAWGSVLFTDSKKLMNDLSDIPLVEGRSLVSEELCTDFIDVYKAIPKKTWDIYDNKSVPLDAISNFVKNCLRRQMVEKEILDEKRAFGSFGIVGSEDKHVDIPSPGVPRDLDVEIPFTDMSEDLSEGKNVDDDEDDPFQSSEFEFSSWNNDDEKE